MKSAKRRIRTINVAYLSCLSLLRLLEVKRLNTFVCLTICLSLGSFLFKGNFNYIEIN